jgi:hypothetical protein
MNVSKKINKNSMVYKTCRRIYSFIRNIFSPFGYIRNYVLFPISGFMRVHHVFPFYKSYEFINDLKDKHKGKRCFIIATGPSLRISDVEMLGNEITIALNSFYKAFEKTKFRPTYYAILDPHGQKELIKNYDVNTKDFAKEFFFMNSIHKEKCSGIKYLPVCYQDHWFKNEDPKFVPEKNLKFSDNLMYGLYDKYTVTNAAIEIAIYMGCNEIYLIGVDCNYRGSSKHFMEKQECISNDEEEILQRVEKNMMTGYRFMENETKQRNIKIYNATRGGMLEEFERVDFDSIVGVKEI